MVLEHKKKKQTVTPPKSELTRLKEIRPRTINQNKIFDAFDDDKHLFIHGSAGTGKSFCALYLALDAVMNEREYADVTIVRSSVPARNQGFLPGNEDEKNEIFEVPYIDICSKLFSNYPYKQLKQHGVIRFMSTSYLRGLTLENTIILGDEIQNFNEGEINTLITRTGLKSKLILVGDTAQNDLRYLREESCVYRLPKIIALMPSFATIEMTYKDIQRNDILKEWIIAQDEVAA